jgi:excisionase family DNA binding protein
VPMLTLGEAARHCGVPKSTISRAIKAGRLSASRDEKGSYAIDPAELFRVYPIKAEEKVAATPATSGAEGGAAHDATPDATEIRIRNAQLEEQIKGLQTIIEMERQRSEHERQRAEDLKAERDKWAEQAARLALPSPRERRSFLGWLRRA